MDPQPQQQDIPNITMYYKNNMSTEYKEDEKILNDFIQKNIKPINPDRKINLIINYRLRKTAEINMKKSC